MQPDIQKTTQLTKKNVLFFARFPPPYCGETIGSQLVYDLLKDDLNITTLELLDNNREIDDGGKFRVMRAIKTLGKIYTVLKLVKSERPDSFYMVPAASKLGHFRDVLIVLFVRPYVGRIVCHIRNGNFHDVLSVTGLQALSRQFIQKTDYFIFLANNLSQRASEMISDEKRVVIPNYIDKEVCFDADEINAKLTYRKNRRQMNILFLSNMHPSKGYMDLLEALGKIQLPVNWVANFVGSWPSDKDKALFLERIKAIGINRQVKVHGPIKDRQKVKTMLAESDVFVLPTYYPIEAQPRSIIESLNAAIPVITTRHASITEYVFDGDNGFLVDKQSPDQIAAALLKLADSDIWYSMAQNARDSYLSTFDQQMIKDKLYETIGG